MKTIYLAGALFGAGERLHNILLEMHLKTLGCKVILPQREALKFFKGGLFDMKAAQADCRRLCSGKKTVCVCTIDGPDADSGTAIEFAYAVAKNGSALVCRTDFRTCLEKEIGINGMFQAEGVKLIYHPCFITEFDEVTPYYRNLAQKIYEVVKDM